MVLPVLLFECRILRVCVHTLPVAQTLLRLVQRVAVERGRYYYYSEYIVRSSCTRYVFVMHVARWQR